MRPADAVRRILNSFFRRQTITPPGPDFGLPEAPEPVPIVPELGQAPGWLFQHIDSLAQRGALDEGHHDLFDPMVEQMVDLWEANQTQDLRQRQAHLASLARAEQELQIMAARLLRKAENADAAVAELDSQITQLLEQAVEADRRRSATLRARPEGGT